MSSKLGWTYEPSQAVRAAHAIPHYYTNGQLYTGNFNLTNLSTDPMATQGWLPTVFAWPIALLVLGLLAIIIMNVLWCFRCFSWCRCLKCAPSEETIEADPLKVVKSRKFVWYWFAFWIVVVLLADHAIFFGNADVDLAIDNGADSFGTLAGMFTNIGAATTDMKKQIDTYNAAAAYAGTCKDPMTTVTSALGGPVGTVADLVSSLPDTLNTLKGYLGQDAKDYKNRIMYVFYVFILAITLAFPVAAVTLRSKCAFYAIMTITWAIVVTLTVICAIIMIFVTVFGDFCMDPARSILTGISATSSSGKMVTYYTSCVGNSPFNSSLSLINSNLDKLITELGTVSTYCSGQASAADQTAWNDVQFNVAKGAIAGMQADFSAIDAATSCGTSNTINMFWDQVGYTFMHLCIVFNVVVCVRIPKRTSTHLTYPLSLAYIYICLPISISTYLPTFLSICPLMQAMNQGVCGNFFNGLFKVRASNFIPC